MKRSVQLFLAAVLSIGVALFGAPGAQAQPINCSAHVFDATVAQSVNEFADVISNAIARFKTVVPTADVYIQAYEQLPGSSLDQDAFTAQCTNWRDSSGKSMKDNVIVVAYGHNVDDFGIYFGGDYEVVTFQYREYITNGVNASSDYVAQALTQPLMDARVYMKHSGLLSDDGIYVPPSQVTDSGYEETDWSAVAVAIALVIAAFTAVGLVLQIAAVARKRFGNRSS